MLENKCMIVKFKNSENSIMLNRKRSNSLKFPKNKVCTKILSK